ncbi:hypothetical protein K458DRAFT_319358 [Lentithecium fluviatile CBS 122367]|uniref:CENP-V/GFA domain-containing protein n=1 Tax=Lentithecium fluviatile CBS 122367 TaxID=1168545 RepID=A0A6G1II33_9PLEO|nr:hypothetical protein K458DRAFT_319358 [Lentithecium fluviatile CBS 122367]
MSDREEPKSSFPVAGLSTDGWSTETEATASCFCGTVQLAFPTTAPGLVTTFICHCTDCHKITASMFASNFVVLTSHLRHLRGQSSLKTFSQNKTIASGKTMTNFFCGTCGSLMYREGEAFPGQSILRIGTVDDFKLMEGVLRPKWEVWSEKRVGWLRGLEGAKEIKGQL